MARLLGAWAVTLAACHFSAGTAGSGDGGRAIDAPPDGLSTMCTPNEMACDGRVVRTCGSDSQWDPTKDKTCAFTCADASCVDASNVPSKNVAMCDATAHALAPPPGATVVIDNSGGAHFECSPNCGEPNVTEIGYAGKLANPNLAWFCLSSIAIPAGMTITVSPGETIDALALIVDGSVSIDGSIVLDGGNATNGMTGGNGAPGAFDGADLSSAAGKPGLGPCGGGGGANSGSSNHWVGGGGGGGGAQSAGAGGGSGECSQSNHFALGALGGLQCGTVAIIPLVGGSGGGGGGDATTGVSQGWAGGGGGGALQISSRVSIAVSGSLTARGGTGYGENSIDGGGGGGAGGALLFEAPLLAVTSGSLVVDGGSGGTSHAGAGGAGATGGALPGPGVSYTAPGEGGTGGGGAGGYVRLNGPMAACPVGASPTASCSTGSLAIAH